MNKMLSLSVGAIWLALPLAGYAAESVPEAGIRAEGKAQWEEAIRVYQKALQADPAQAHLWERIADIQARRGDKRACVDALTQAVRYAPNSARLYAKLSEAQAESNAPAEALQSIDHAVQLEPDNLAYLRKRAQLAVWNKDNSAARDSYARILAKSPDDEEAQLGQARIYRWAGESEQAEAAYRDYLERHPQNGDARLEYCAVITERGDYALALEELERYRQQFGETTPYLKQRARVLAWAGRPTEALTITERLQAANPDDYDVAYTRTLALSAGHRPVEALQSLATVTRLRPDSKETSDLQRFTKTPLRSNLNLTVGYRSSSDQISIRNMGLDGAYVISPETRILAGADAQRVHAPVGSGLEQLNGTPNATYRREWVGVRHLLSPQAQVEAQVGSGTVGNGQSTIYDVNLRWWPQDEWTARLGRKHEFFAVSPRAMSWNIRRDANTLDLQWTPDLRYTVAAGTAYDTFSDGNSRYEYYLAPRRAVLRNQTLNLDLGVSGRWFGYNMNPNHGYYAPSLYQRYAVTAFSYWKIDDDDGISLSASWGVHKDNTMTGYRNGGDLVGEGFFGIYRDWMLDVRASLLSYGGGATAGYRSRMLEFVLTRRF